jgi:hypothetical protein
MRGGGNGAAKGVADAISAVSDGGDGAASKRPCLRALGARAPQEAPKPKRPLRSAAEIGALLAPSGSTLGASSG